MARVVVALAVLAALLGACSSGDEADRSDSIEAGAHGAFAPPDLGPGETLLGTGVLMVGPEGFVQVCFRAVEQDGALLCAEARASVEPHEYEFLDVDAVEMRTVDQTLFSIDEVHLIRQDADSVVTLFARPVEPVAEP